VSDNYHAVEIMDGPHKGRFFKFKDLPRIIQLFIDEKAHVGQSLCTAYYEVKDFDGETYKAYIKKDTCDENI
jgi:hypothetical protein